MKHCQRGCVSDEAVFRAAAWSKMNVPELAEKDFMEPVRREQPRFSESWIASKWALCKGMLMLPSHDRVKWLESGARLRIETRP